MGELLSVSTGPGQASDLRFHAMLQALSLKVSAAAVPLAPNLDECGAAMERAREELSHLELVLLGCSEDLEAELSREAMRAVEAIPSPTSWREAIVAQLVLGLACQAETRRRLTAEGQTRELIRMLGDQGEHLEAAKAALRDLREDHSNADRELSAVAARWLVFALEALDEGCRALYMAELQRQTAPFFRWRTAS